MPVLRQRRVGEVPHISSSEWARRRGLVMRRDGGRCQIGGPRCAGAARDVDHIVPRAEWVGADVGLHALSNLRAVCQPCHKDRRRPGATRGGWFDAPD